MCEVKMAGYWPTSLLCVYKPRLGRGSQTHTLLHTLFFIFLDLFTERACPQLAKANLGGPLLNNKQITKIQRQKLITKKKKYIIK